MKTTALWVLALAGVMLAGCAETTVSQAVIDPQADQALQAMSGLLQSTPAFHFRVNAAVDKMSPTGHLVQVTHESEVLVRRPDCMASQVTTEYGQRSLRYKGQSLSVVDTGRKQYATAVVPGNIDAMFDCLFDEYDLTLPLADLLFSDAYGVLTENVETGVYVGLHMAGGKPCHHLLFTQETIDWQVWIDAGDQPLPRRLVITYKLEPHQPQYVANLGDWNLAPAVGATAFDFKKPADAKLVDLKDLLGVKVGAPESTGADNPEELKPADESARVGLLSLTGFETGPSGLVSDSASVVLTGFDDNQIAARGAARPSAAPARSSGGGNRSASGGGGRGTVRYSAPAARSSAPAVRSSTPSARPNTSVARSSTVNRGAGASSFVRPNTGVAQQPNRYGTLLNQPTRGIERPIGSAAVGGVRGSGGAVAGGVRGSGGTVAAGARGSGGAYAGGVRGSAGRAGVVGRGPYGYQSYASLPYGSNRVDWHGSSYWRNGWSWYQPYYYGDTLYYGLSQPPIGWVVAQDELNDLLANATTAAINGQNYYYYHDGYYAAQPSGQYVAVADPTAAPPAVAAVAVNPQAMDQLQRMSDFLATVKACSITIHATSDEILDSGQKIQVESTRTVAVRAPDRMAVDFVADGETRRSVYDGKTMTVFEKEGNDFSQQAMPPTLDATIDTLETKYGMAAPAAEMLRPGLLDRLKPKLQSADYIGMETIDGVPCHHVAISMDWADCQFWIQDGAQPLPRKLVITYKQVPSTPKYAMDFSAWNLTSPPDSAFAMAIPADAKKIDMAPLDAKE